MGRGHRIIVGLLAVASVSAAIPTAGAGEPAASSAGEPERLLVRLRPGASEALIAPVLSVLGLDLDRSLRPIGVLVVAGPAGRLEQALSLLRLHPAVDEVERDVRLAALETRPNDVHWPGQWGFQRTGFASVWDVARGSRETIIGVVDTGVERSHPDLRTTVLPGYDFVDGDAYPSDELGHGTAVAGLLGARGNNRTGIAGACWNCRILPVRVVGRDGTGSSSAVAAGIVWAVDHGAAVINLSLGGRGTTMALEGAVAYAARHDVVLVAAAGNDGSTRPFYPAASSHVIAVAATDRSDRLYPWSNRGAWVELAAPGCNTAPWRGASYATFCGTSAAAPLVAGLAGLVRSANPHVPAAAVERLLGEGRLDAPRAFPDFRPRPDRSLQRELVGVMRRSVRAR